jgi:uncharacterized membrane protein
MPVFRNRPRSAARATDDPFLQTPMATESSASEPERRPARADYEAEPLTRQEYIAAIVHLYRGEVYRATVQRTRLDMTTNWAVLTTAGLLAFSFRADSNPHWALLIGMLLVTLFLSFEARRYQMFDVWRSRVRKIEENFYGPILRRDPVSPRREWGQLVADDLFRPRFKVTRAYALRKRLLRNYWAVFLVLIGAWVVKLIAHPTPADEWSIVRSRLGVGLLPWWLPLLFVAAFLGLVAWAVVKGSGNESEEGVN